MTDQEANEIERREWAEKMAKREAESNANFGAGVSSLDSHIMDVEASGEDKKHEAPMPVAMPLPKGYLMWNPERLQDGRWFCHVQPVLQGAASEPMYTYADVVHYGNRCAQAAAAEAVKQERERILSLVLALESAAADRHKATMRGFSSMVNEISFPSKDQP